MIRHMNILDDCIDNYENNQAQHNDNSNLYGQHFEHKQEQDNYNSRRQYFDWAGEYHKHNHARYDDDYNSYGQHFDNQTENCEHNSDSYKRYFGEPSEEEHIDTEKYIDKCICSHTTKDCRSCEDAVKNGHLSCLQYLHEHGYSWNANVCMIAVKNDNLACLEYAYENCCEMDIEECVAVATGKCKEYLNKIMVDVTTKIC